MRRMPRWILLLLVPCIALAADLSGTWSMPGLEQGFVNRVEILDASDKLYFRYESDGVHACEVIGIARRRSDTLYVFRNIKEDQIYENYEGYGLEENEDCEVSFQLDGRVLKIDSTGNCKSFCGMHGAIGGELQQVSTEPVDVPRGTQP